MSRFLLQRPTNPFSPRPFNLVSLAPLSAGETFRIVTDWKSSNPIKDPEEEEQEQQSQITSSSSSLLFSPLLDLSTEPENLYQLLQRRYLWKPSYFASSKKRRTLASGEEGEELANNSNNSNNNLLNEILLPPSALFIPTPTTILALMHPTDVSENQLKEVSASSKKDNNNNNSSLLKNASSISFKEIQQQEEQELEESERNSNKNKNSGNEEEQEKEKEEKRQQRRHMISLRNVLMIPDACSVPVPRNQLVSFSPPSSRSRNQKSSSSNSNSSSLSFWHSFRPMMEEYEEISPMESNCLVEFGKDPAKENYGKLRELKKMKHESRKQGVLKRQRKEQQNLSRGGESEQHNNVDNNSIGNEYFDNEQQQQQDEDDSNQENVLVLKITKDLPKGSELYLSYGREYWAQFVGSTAFTQHQSLSRVRWVEKYLNDSVRDIPTAFPDISVGRLPSNKSSSSSSSYVNTASKKKISSYFPGHFFLVDRTTETPANDVAVLHEFLRRSCCSCNSSSMKFDNSSSLLLKDCLNIAAQQLLENSAMDIQRKQRNYNKNNNDIDDDEQQEQLFRLAAEKAARGGTSALLQQPISIHQLRVLLAADILRGKKKGK